MVKFLFRSGFSLVVVSVVVLLAQAYFSSNQTVTINGYLDLYDDSQSGDLPRALEIIGSVYAGLISSALFAALNEIRSNTLQAFGSALAARSLLVASIISPIVIAGVYDRLSAINSTVLLLLFGYQNGFLWESLISPIRRPHAAE